MAERGLASWAKSLPWELITNVSTHLNVDDCLIAAIIQQESAGCTFRVRAEPTFAYLEAPERWSKRLGITKESEICCQKMSWGLMQLMGATARSIGYEDHLTEMIYPEIGMYWGALYLSQKLKKYQSIKAAVSAYNAGSLRVTAEGRVANQAYVDSVMELYSQLTK
jgi:soluble lytic murein transglycosylase-like protein